MSARPTDKAATAAQVPPPKRNSGGKRTNAESEATDVINIVGDPKSGGQTSSLQPPTTRRKITYALPHQNMEEGHFYVVLGEDVDVSTQRFKILSLLGEGTFGKVVEAWDRKRKEYCAVKVIRNVPRYTRDAEFEIHYMMKVLKADPKDEYAVMKVLRYFSNDSGHTCIVMPKYGPSTLSWLQKNGSLPPRYLAEVIFHTATALDFLHTQINLIHTDLKPENLLFESSAPSIIDPVLMRPVPPTPCRVRICDLGGCCDDKHVHTAVVSTRHYRSPEVILGLGWMFSTDMWSMGCIIYELATGRLLYDTHDSLEHLHMMEKSIGKFPAEFFAKSSENAVKEFFTPNGSLRLLSSGASSSAGLNASHGSTSVYYQRVRPIRDVIADSLLQNLILSLLEFDKTRRLTARKLAMHPFVSKYFPESLMHPLHPNNRRGLPPEPKF